MTLLTRRNLSLAAVAGLSLAPLVLVKFLATPVRAAPPPPVGYREGDGPTIAIQGAWKSKTR